jgi:hypothetical protein
MPQSRLHHDIRECILSTTTIGIWNARSAQPPFALFEQKRSVVERGLWAVWQIPSSEYLRRTGIIQLNNEDKIDSIELQLQYDLRLQELIRKKGEPMGIMYLLMLKTQIKFVRVI